MYVYSFPDGRGANSFCPGWVVSTPRTTGLPLQSPGSETDSLQSTGQFSPSGPSPFCLGLCRCHATQLYWGRGWTHHRSIEVFEQLSGESRPFQFPREEEPLLGRPRQQPGQVQSDVDDQEFPGVHYDILGLAGVENQVIQWTALGQVSALLSVQGWRILFIP